MSTKTPLILLPGLLSNHVLWKHQIDHLSEVATIQVIPSFENTTEKMIKAILERAPPKFTLAGHSMGGWLSLELMRAAPSRIQRLCLLNTTARADSEEKRSGRQQLIRRAEDGQFPEIVKEIVEKFVFNPAAKTEVEKMFLSIGEQAFICQERAMLARTETESILSKITCPTLVIHAANDKVFSLADHQELVEAIPNATLAVVENSGHMSPMEAPDVITTLLRGCLESK